MFYLLIVEIEFITIKFSNLKLIKIFALIKNKTVKFLSVNLYK